MAAYVHADWPGQVVSTELAFGVPGDVLRTAAGNAELLVVGADEPNRVTEAVSGSVPGDLRTTTPCPLAVLAFDEHGTAQAAISYAFAVAARLRRPLIVLHCLPPGSRDASGSVEHALAGPSASTRTSRLPTRSCTAIPGTC